jgi:hypothetical protein
MNFKIVTHFMPWEIDYAEKLFQKLKKSSFYLNKNDTLYIDSYLNLSEYIIDWKSSSMPKEFFCDKYNTISRLLEGWSVHNKNIYTGDKIYGHLDAQKNSIQKDVDFYINICPDMYFHEHLLFYMMESAKNVKSKYFMITPETHKVWDNTWDCITHEKYLTTPNEKWNAIDIDEIEYHMSNLDEKPILAPSSINKWAGWFDLYNKEFYENLVPVPDDWSGYGGLDLYQMIAVNIGQKNGLDFKQYILKNQIVFEYNIGIFKEDNYATYYKKYLKLTNTSDRHNQRKKYDDNMNHYITEWINKTYGKNNVLHSK